VLLTNKGIASFTVLHPGEKDKTCVQSDDRVDCTTTYVPPTETTYTEPTAEFVVVRVPMDAWGKLPDVLRPAPVQ
jgi:hypothetical protein